MSPTPVSVSYGGATLEDLRAAFFKAGERLSTGSPTSGFPLQSWEVLAKEGVLVLPGPLSAAVSADCYTPCNKIKVLTSLDALC